MSLHEYIFSQKLAMDDSPFYALIMAAMRKADSDNEAKLRGAWPEVWDEFFKRYHSDGGVLEDEVTDWELVEFRRRALRGVV